VLLRKDKLIAYTRPAKLTDKSTNYFLIGKSKRGSSTILSLANAEQVKNSMPLLTPNDDFKEDDGY